MGEEALELLARQSRLPRATERIGHRARTWCGLGLGIGAGTADVMLVLGDVGEMGEVAEGADDGEGAAHRQAAHDLLQLLARALVGVAMELHPGAADVLDQLEHFLAFLGAHGVAEDPAEQPDVVTQRGVFFRGLGGFQAVHGAAVQLTSITPSPPA